MLPPVVLFLCGSRALIMSAAAEMRWPACFAQVSMLLHSADLHSAVMPPKLDQLLADLICQEFEAQATLETGAGMQPTVMDTSTPLAKASMEVCTCLFLWPVPLGPARGAAQGANGWPMLPACTRSWRFSPNRSAEKQRKSVINPH